MTRIMVIEKQTDKSKAPASNLHSKDLSGAQDINELFDQMENMEMPKRIHAEDAQEASAAAIPVDKPIAPARAEKPATAQELAPGDQVTIDGKSYPVEEYVTNGGKSKTGVWMANKADASEYSNATFQKSGKGWFVAEHWLNKAGIKADADGGSTAFQSRDSDYTDPHDQATPDTTPDGASRVRMLDIGVRRFVGAEAGDPIHPYEARVVPGNDVLQQIAGVFGTKIQGFGLAEHLDAAQKRKFGFLNGVFYNKTLFIRDSG